MNESLPIGGGNIREAFSKPDLFAAKGEFERVGKTFNIDSSVLLWAAEKGGMVTLTEDVWATLHNTDSYSISKDDHELANSMAEVVGRDYHSVAEAVYGGVLRNEPIAAPIVMKYGDMYHLVSGNTRLMAIRAYGATPKVWMFEVDRNEI